MATLAGASAAILMKVKFAYKVVPWAITLNWTKGRMRCQQVHLTLGFINTVTACEITYGCNSDVWPPVSFVINSIKGAGSGDLLGKQSRFVQTSKRIVCWAFMGVTDNCTVSSERCCLQKSTGGVPVISFEKQTFRMWFPIDEHECPKKISAATLLGLRDEML